MTILLSFAHPDDESFYAVGVPLEAPPVEDLFAAFKPGFPRSFE